jgi:hypothetical protein
MTDIHAYYDGRLGAIAAVRAALAGDTEAARAIWPGEVLDHRTANLIIALTGLAAEAVIGAAAYEDITTDEWLDKPMHETIRRDQERRQP